MKDPIKTSSCEQDDIRFLQGHGASRTDTVHIAVIDDSLTHRRSQHGNVGHLNESIDNVLGPTVSSTFADDEQRPLGRFQEIDCTFDVFQFRTASRRFETGERSFQQLWVCTATEKITGKVQVSSACAFNNVFKLVTVDFKLSLGHICATDLLPGRPYVQKRTAFSTCSGITLRFAGLAAYLQKRREASTCWHS